MIAPASAPSAPPLTAPCWVLGPVPTQPENNVVTSNEETRRVLLFMGRSGFRSRLPCASPEVVEATAKTATTKTEAQADRDGRIPISRIRIIGRPVAVAFVIHHPGCGLINHR